MIDVNGNDHVRCVDCGVFSIVTHPIAHKIGNRRVIETVCGRCYLKRQPTETVE